MRHCFFNIKSEMSKRVTFKCCMQDENVQHMCVIAINLYLLAGTQNANNTRLLVIQEIIWWMQSRN